MKALAIAAGAFLALVALAFVGLLVRPRTFVVTDVSKDHGSSRLTTDLPAPVARFAKEVAAEGLPRIDTAAITGSGVIRRGPMTIPMRFKGEYRPAREYRREMEMTWFGIPVVKGLDTWAVGKGRMEVMGKVWEGPDLDQGSNMASFAEALWMPSVLLTDARVRWEAIDDTHARCVFPFEDGTDSMTYTFDEETGRPVSATAMRYKAGEPHKTEWITRTLEWGTIDGRLTPVRVDARWGDEERPWAEFVIEHIALNAPVPGLDGMRK
jgi:hypothetical protein